ncbi:MAG TPA: Ig-like domain-containing protein [Woeseiaceae bacterium]
MYRVSRFLPVALVPAGLLLVLGGCGGGYGGDGGASAANQITSIEVTPAEATITMDGTQQFTAVASNDAGDTVAAGSLDWRSSNTAVAEVDTDGLATAVGPGTAMITARKDTSSIYSGGGIVISNQAELTVTDSSGLSGMAAAPAPMSKALVVVRDQAGNSQTVMTDGSGRFRASVAGMTPPFLLQVSDQQGHSFFSASVKAGVVNVNPLTDLLVRAWFSAHGMQADAAFSGSQAPGGPDGEALEGMSRALAKAFRETLSSQGLEPAKFSFFTAPHAGGAGMDRVLSVLRARVGPSQMAIDDVLSGRHADILASPDGLEFRVRPGAEEVTAVPLFRDDL